MPFPKNRRGATSIGLTLAGLGLSGILAVGLYRLVNTEEAGQARFSQSSTTRTRLLPDGDTLTEYYTPEPPKKPREYAMLKPNEFDVDLHYTSLLYRKMNDEFKNATGYYYGCYAVPNYQCPEVMAYFNEHIKPHYPEAVRKIEQEWESYEDRKKAAIEEALKDFNYHLEKAKSGEYKMQIIHGKYDWDCVHACLAMLGYPEAYDFLPSGEPGNRTLHFHTAELGIQTYVDLKIPPGDELKYYPLPVMWEVVRPGEDPSDLFAAGHAIVRYKDLVYDSNLERGMNVNEWVQYYYKGKWYSGAIINQLFIPPKVPFRTRPAM